MKNFLIRIVIVVSLCNTMSLFGKQIPKGLYWELSTKMFKNPKKYIRLDNIQNDITYIHIYNGSSFRTFRRVTGIPEKGETIPDYYGEFKLCQGNKWCRYSLGKKVIVVVKGEKTTKLTSKINIRNGYLISQSLDENGKERSGKKSYFVRITDKKIIKAYLRHVELTHKYSLKDLGFDDKNENKLYQVTAGSGLIARVKPSTKSKHVDWVPANGRVYVISKTKVKQTIEGKTAYWVKVKLMNGKIGYMFSGFLEKTP